MKIVLLLPLLLLTACATPAARSGLLSSYDGMKPRERTLRASITERRDDPALLAVKRVRLGPVTLAPGAANAWLSAPEAVLLKREVEAQLCFEFSKRYQLAAPAEDADAEVRAVLAGVQPTGRFGSALSAASSFFIPGPLGVRVPGGLGGLAAEAEMLDRENRQLAAVTWNRTATAVGTDDPSLSRIGDALQFAAPFADAAAAAMTAKAAPRRPRPEPDPCAAYGPRIRPEGFLASFATGLYVPELSGARAEPQAARPKDPE